MNELIFFSINRYKNQIHTYTIYIHHLGLVDKSACIVLGPPLSLERRDIYESCCCPKKEDRKYARRRQLVKCA